MDFAFNKFNIKDLGSFEEMVVELGVTEVRTDPIILLIIYFPS